MGKSPLKVVVEIKISSITCPNVLLDPSKWINVRICLLGFHLRSRLLKAQFPLQVEEKFRVERTFPLCNTPLHLYSALAGERLAIELVQLFQMESKTLARFHANLNDVLFGDPHSVREREVRSEYLSLILHTTNYFPGFANPHMNASVIVRVMPVKNPAAEMSRDGGENVTLGLKAFEHPYYGIPLNDPPCPKSWICSSREQRPRLCQKMRKMVVADRKKCEMKEKISERKTFVVRHVDDKLIGRTPSSEPEPPLFHNQSCCGRRALLKSPFHKSTSHLDTISSLLRRKPHIVRPVHSNSLEADIDTDWCSDNHARCQTNISYDPYYNHVHGSSCNEWDEHQIPDVKVYWTNHQPDMCAVCQLYQQYFGEFYPRHSV